MSERRNPALTEGPVMDHILRMVVPMSIAISANFLVALIDAYWLGQLGENELAAVGVAFPITFAVFAVAIGLSSGAIAAVARAVGAGDRDAVRRMTTDAILLGLIVCAMVSVIGVGLSPLLARLMNASGELLDLTVIYLQIWFWGLVFLAGPVIANGIMRALGNIMTPSVLMISTAFINMILDPLLIFGVGPFPRMEMAGAALATVLANACAAVLFALILVFRERLISFAGASWQSIKAHWITVARVGLPAAVSTGINPVALAFVVASLARFGGEGDNAALAAFTAASRVETFAVIPMFALSGVIGPLTGQNQGAGLPHRVRATFRAGVVFCIVWSLVLAVVLALGGRFITDAIIGANQEARAIAAAYLWITPISMWGYGIVMAASAGFNGLSRPRPALVMTVLRSMALIAPAAWIGGALWNGPIGAFIGIAAANVLAGAIVAWWTLSPQLSGVEIGESSPA